MVANLNTLVQKIVVQADTRGLDSLAKSMRKLSASANKIKQAFAAAIPVDAQIEIQKLKNQYETLRTSQANYAQTQMTIRAKEKTALQQQITETKKAEYAVTEEYLALQRLNNEKQKGINQTKQLISADKNAQAIMRENTAEINKQTAAKRLETQLSRERVANLRRETQAVKQQSSAMLGLKSILGYFVGIHTVFSFFRTAREIDLLQSSIKGLTGSTQDFEYLTQEAFRTATAIEDISQSYKGFYAAANMSGFSKSQIQEQFSSLLTGLRGAGLKQTPIKFALLSVEQMYSKGKIQAEELRRQLANALPGAFEFMASAANVTTAELSEMMKKGLLPANKYVPLLIKEIERYYKTGFIENVKSLDAAFLNLHNATVLLVDSMMKTDMSKGLVEGIKSLTDLLRDKNFIYLLARIGDLIGLIFSLVSKVLKLVSSNLPIIIFFLGNAGLAGILAKIVGWSNLWVRFWKILFGGKMLLAIRSMRGELFLLSTPFLRIYKWLILIMGLAIAAQDLIYSLPGMGLLGFRGMTGEYFKNIPYSDEDPNNERKIHRRRHNDFSRLRKDFAQQFNMSSTPLRDSLFPISNPYSFMTTQAGNFNLNKDQSVNINSVIINESQNGLATYQSILDSVNNVAGGQ